MNFRDTFVTCEECGKQFILRVETQRQMAERGQEVVIPDLCETCTRQISYGGKLRGRIKWFSMEKGYGFITQENGTELFVHRTGVLLTGDGTLPSLDEGQEVLYEAVETPKGAQAVQVTPYTAG